MSFQIYVLVTTDGCANPVDTQIGLSASQGSVVGALLNLGQGLGRPVVGIFSDSIGRINIAGLCTLVGGLFCFAIWIPAKTYGVLIFFAIIVGTVGVWTCYTVVENGN